jgi:hypothetical protein
MLARWHGSETCVNGAAAWIGICASARAALLPVRRADRAGRAERYSNMTIIAGK